MLLVPLTFSFLLQVFTALDIILISPLAIIHILYVFFLGSLTITWFLMLELLHILSFSIRIIISLCSTLIISFQGFVITFSKVSYPFFLIFINLKQLIQQFHSEVLRTPQTLNIYLRRDHIFSRLLLNLPLLDSSR